MVNLYRLLKVALPDAESRRLEARGEHRVIALLIASLAGFPREGAQLLERIMSSKLTTWTEFIGTLEPPNRAVAAAGTGEGHVPRKADGPNRRATPDATITEQTTEHEWHRLQEAVGGIPVDPSLQSMDVFRHWAPFVARYAFWGGPRLTEQ